MDKRLGTFLGRFPIHTGPTPPLTPQIMLDNNLGNAKLQTRNCGLRFAVYLMLKVSNIELIPLNWSRVQR